MYPVEIYQPFLIVCQKMQCLNFLLLPRSKQIDIMPTGTPVVLMALAQDCLNSPSQQFWIPSLTSSMCPFNQARCQSSSKKLRIIPVYKSGDRESINKYRPISILPVCSKILEIFVHSHLNSYLEQHSLLCGQQSGFCSKHSTTAALVNLHDQLLQNMNNGTMTGTIFIDLCKAFDTMDHSILLQKLRSYGVRGWEHLWFTSYLDGRSQQVDFKNKLFDSMPVTVGVPQESILGPLLFIIFVNDLPESVKHSSIDLYVNDTTMKTAHHQPAVTEQRLNEDLASLTAWMSMNRLLINLDKTVCMPTGMSQRVALVPSSEVSPHVEGTNIKQEDSSKLLGVIIHPHLTWEQHIDYVCKKMSRKIGLLRHLQPVLPHSALLAMYKTDTAPLWLLQYCFGKC